MEHIRPQESAVEGDVRSPVVPNDDRTLLAERMQEANYISNQLEHVVRLDPGRLIGLTEATLIRCHDVVSGVGECGELMSPGIPALGKSMAQDDERTVSQLGNVH